VVVVDWFVVFDGCIRLLRALAKAERAGLAFESGVVTSFCREADGALSSAILNESATPPQAVGSLRELLPKVA